MKLVQKIRLLALGKASLLFHLIMSEVQSSGCHK